ncbi:MAG: hypothetical protein ACRYF0_11175 [Janthinobacterium lividum]
MQVERDAIKNYTNGYYVQVYGYKRVGDAIRIPVAENEWYIRSFTPTSFIKEVKTSYRGFNQYTIHYHR